jgi:hypothetical protein
MFVKDDEVRVIANKYGKEYDSLIGKMGIVEKVDSFGVWITLYDPDDHNEYVCDESEIELFPY